MSTYPSLKNFQKIKFKISKKIWIIKLKQEISKLNSLMIHTKGYFLSKTFFHHLFYKFTKIGQRACPIYCKFIILNHIVFSQGSCFLYPATMIRTWMNHLKNQPPFSRSILSKISKQQKNTQKKFLNFHPDLVTNPTDWGWVII